MKRTVTIGGKEHPISFGLTTFREFKKATDIDIIAAGETMKLGVDEITWLIYLALKNGAKAAEKNFDYSLDDVSDWFTSLDEIMIVMNEFTESMPTADKMSDKKKEIQIQPPNL